MTDKRPRAGSILEDRGSSTWRIQSSDHASCIESPAESAGRKVAERQNGGFE